jgi:hypothetical protein
MTVRRPTPPPVHPSLPPDSAPPDSAPPDSAPPSSWSPARARPAVTGLGLTLFAGVLGIVAGNLPPSPNPAENTIFGDIGYVIAMSAAVAALVSKRHRQPLLYFVLGSWFITVSGVIFDALAVRRFHLFSFGAHWTLYYGAVLVSDLAGLIAVILLLAALRGTAERGGWPSARSLPALLFAVIVLAEVAWRAQELTRLVGPEYYRNSFTFPSDAYPYLAAGVLSVLLAAFVASYGLTFKNHVLGGALLLGWSLSETFGFLAWITEGWYFRHRTVADNALAAVLLVTSVVLAAVYTRRRRSAA